jgi:hypothetical protein
MDETSRIDVPKIKKPHKHNTLVTDIVFAQFPDQPQLHPQNRNLLDVIIDPSCSPAYDTDVMTPMSRHHTNTVNTRIV